MILNIGDNIVKSGRYEPLRQRKAVWDMMLIILEDMGGQLAVAAPKGINKQTQSAWTQNQSVRIKNGNIIGELDPAAKAPWVWWVAKGAKNLHRRNPGIFLIEWVRYTFKGLKAKPKRSINASKYKTPAGYQKAVERAEAKHAAQEDSMLAAATSLAFMIGASFMHKLHKGNDYIEPVLDRNAERNVNMLTKAMMKG